MKTAFLAGGLIVLLSACTQPKKAPEARSYPVTLNTATQRDILIYVEAIANVYSLATVQIRPQVTGIVLEASVKQGDYVKAGDILYKIDPRPYEAALETAKGNLLKDKATLEFAKIRLERNSELAKKDFISKLTYDQYSSDVDVAQGQVQADEGAVKTAELNLEWTSPKSPIDGKISAYNIDPGNLVLANDPNALTDVRQISPADVRFNINQSDFVRVQQAKKDATLRFFVYLPQDPNKPREGDIYFIDNHIDTNTGTILVKGTVDNQDEFLWPGEFVRVQLVLRQQPNAVLVPDEAVGIGQDGPFVYVYQPSTSTVDYRKVVKGESLEHSVVIEKGVNPGEQVVTKGQVNLRPGVKAFIADGAKDK